MGADAGRPTVLVVDDEADLRVLTRRMLGNDYRVLDAEGVAPALELMRSHQVDVVLLDVMMPGVDGLTGLKALKAAAPGNLPVILLTALDMQEDRNAGLQAGASDYLTKPVNRRELLLRVGNFVKLRSQELLIAQQVRALEELSWLKDELVGLLVHDLRNPLAGTLGALQLLKRDEPGADEDVGLALRGARQMEELLEDLVLARGLECQTLPLAPERVSLTGLLRQAAAEVAQVAAERRVTIALEAPELFLSADRRLVHRAIGNLLKHAIRYTQQRVEVTLAAQGDGAEVRVVDFGPPLTSRDKAMLFEKFGGVGERAPADRRGLGVGLYLVRLIATSHGGKVYVEDRAPAGAAIGLRLTPLAG